MKKTGSKSSFDPFGTKKRKAEKEAARRRAEAEKRRLEEERLQKKAAASKKRKKWIGIILLAFLLIGVLYSLVNPTETVSNTGDVQQAVEMSPETPAPAKSESPSVIEATPTPEVMTVEETVPEENSSLEIIFISVGQGDATLIRCDGHAMLIDGGMSNQSSKIYTILKNREITSLDYIVATHAHEDHVGGLAGALNYATAKVALAPVSEADNKPFQSFVKYLDQQGVSVTIPSVNDEFSLGSATFRILGPISFSSEPNNTSLVIRLSYGNFHALFTGDAEYSEEQEILGSGNSLQSDVLKVGHHGSNSSSGYQWIYEINPKIAVISCGAGNMYGHPHEEVLSRFRDADVKVLRTDLQGDITITVQPSGEYTYSVTRNATADTLVPGSEAVVKSEPTPTPTPEPVQQEQANSGQNYVVNTNTGKFHYPWCSSVDQMSAANRWDYAGTRDDLLSMGYDPCKRCNP